MPIVPGFPIISNEAFREIFQSLSERILMVDEDGYIVTANHVSEKLFGYQAEELRGLLPEELLPDRYKGHRLRYQKELPTGRKHTF